MTRKDSNGAKLERQVEGYGRGRDSRGLERQSREVRGQGATSKTMRYGPLE